MAYEVTIGIPVYNVEKYIRLTMDSALSQTFESIEFLVLDDCGTDSSIDVVREYQQTHPRGKDISIVRQPQNKGLGEARNRILSVAHGRYIYFMDSDDTIAPNTIELLYDKAQQYDADIVYGSIRRVLLYDNNKEILIRHPDRVFLKENEFAEYAFSEYGIMPASTCNFLIKLDVYRNNNLHYQPINYWEDFTFTMDLPTFVTRVVLLSDLTYNYMCRTESLSKFSQRNHIKKDEILLTMRAITNLKDRSGQLVDRIFFSQRMWKVMMTCFYVVCSILRKEKIIAPSFAKSELRDFMKYPISLSMVCSFKKWRMRHLALFMIGELPASLSIFLIRMMAKRKGLLSFI